MNVRELTLHTMNCKLNAKDDRFVTCVCIARILSQLTDSIRAYFPAISTRKYACDVSVTTLLRSRTLGNSPTALQNEILEVHSGEWLRKQLSYLSDCKRHK